MSAHRRYRILTWHVHGNYLLYLTQVPHDFYVLSKPDRSPGYTGRWGHLPWGDNVHDCDVEQAREMDFDCIVFQSREHFLNDQFTLLSERQRNSPQIYIEHDPPQLNPTDTRHPVHDTRALVVHVTAFNQLMWDNGTAPTRVIDHGVLVPGDVIYTGIRPRGIVVVNHLRQRGRRLGADVFERARSEVSLDLVGMAAEESGGLGEVRYPQLFPFIADYRFFFNPIRYTSLGLAVCEAMSIGMPIVGLATTEMVTAVTSGYNGYVDTNVDRLIDVMKELNRNPGLAWEWGANARRRARARFGIDRFVADWCRLLDEVSEGRSSPAEDVIAAARESDDATDAASPEGAQP